MAKDTPAQRRTVGRVMHEFKHGELKSGPGGKAGKVKSRRQAVAIALKEAGESKYESPRENERNYRRTKQKEGAGRTGQQEREGKRRIGARGQRESTPAMGGRSRKPSGKQSSGRRRVTKARGNSRRASTRRNTGANRIPKRGGRTSSRRRKAA